MLFKASTSVLLEGGVNISYCFTTIIRTGGTIGNNERFANRVLIKIVASFADRAFKYCGREEGVLRGSHEAEWSVYLNAFVISYTVKSEMEGVAAVILRVSTLGAAIGHVTVFAILYFITARDSWINILCHIK